MTSNITRSREVIENLKITQGESNLAYAYAFGWAWAMLTDEQRDTMLALAEQKVAEKESN